MQYSARGRKHSIRPGSCHLLGNVSNQSGFLHRLTSLMAEEKAICKQRGGSSAANLFEATRGGLLLWALGIVYGDFV